MKPEKGLLSDINIIPLVDIILVILIVFMITAPLLTTKVEVDLPKVKKAKLVKSHSRVLKITITRAGKIKINGKSVSLRRLARWLKEAKKHGLIKEVQIEADRRCKYGKVVKVLSVVKSAGFESLSLLTQPET